MKATWNTCTLARLICLSVLVLQSGIAAPVRDADALARAPTNTGESLRLAISDLDKEFGRRYPKGREYLARHDALQKAGLDPAEKKRRLAELRTEALLDNPLLDFGRLILLQRKRGQLGLPVNHKCNSGIEQTGYDNDIATLSHVGPGGERQTLFRPEGSGYVGEMDLDFDAERLLFTMPRGGNWQVFEIAVDGTGLRQVTRMPRGVDNFDACYLPDGRIIFASTASYHAVPCWHGEQRACTIYRMDADGSNVRQLCFDQDLDLHPAVLPSGQVLFNRWDYTGILHMYLAPLIAMNPDGTRQMAVYGSNSYWPNRLYFARGIPGDSGRVIAIAAGYHGPPRMGTPVLIDMNRGWKGGDGVIQFVPGRDLDFDDSVKVDRWNEKVWPKYLHPFPLAEPETNRGSGKYFLVAMQPEKNAPWGIYLIDTFDNVVPVLVDTRWDFFEPMPLQKTTKPPVIPDRVDYTCDDAVINMQDVYQGPGMDGVPRGTIKKLRVVAYHFGFPGLAGPDKVGLGGPWEAMRILGTVHVHADGSSAFRAPANTPLSLQPLDAEGKAVQLMRSWYTAMPGETVSCIGCHEEAKDAPAVRYSLAGRHPPEEIEPWYGPPRGFDFEREVQPVLDKYCLSCHDGQSRDDGKTVLDLRAERHHPDYGGHPLARLGAERLHPSIEKHFGGKQIKYTPAYEALVPYVRRVGIEDEVDVLVPGEYHADTSELIQILNKGHHGVKLDAEAWDRIITWIDLNAPCHGTWGDVAPIPENAGQRRWQLQQQYGGPGLDFEKVPDLPHQHIPESKPEGARLSTPAPLPELPGWPFNAPEAKRLQREDGNPTLRNIGLGEGITMKLVRIPAGKFVMGDGQGEADESPASVVSIDEPFWMGMFEVTNEQFRRFHPEHQTRYFSKRYPGFDGPGLALDAPSQPAIRVSWQQASAFCQWLSARTGLDVWLPTEAQWEYACRAGTSTGLSYGSADADFSQHANVADQALAIRTPATGGLTSAIVNPYLEGEFNGIMLDSVFGGDIPCNSQYADTFAATAEVGRLQPNPWELHDMHGNVAEWTSTTYGSYPYREDGRNTTSNDGEKVVRGGSFRDRPYRCRSAFRLSYPAWQRVHNVGFRVVAEIP